MASTSPGSVAAQFTSGVQAIARISSQLDGAQWEQPACGEWNATETIRHVLAVARWYHTWLDRALDDDLSRPFLPEDMDRQNAAELMALPELDGPTVTTP